MVRSSTVGGASLSIATRSVSEMMVMVRPMAESQ